MTVKPDLYTKASQFFISQLVVVHKVQHILNEAFYIGKMKSFVRFRSILWVWLKRLDDL